MLNRPDALARVMLLPTALGGRGGPTPPIVFGCIMTIRDMNFDVRLRLGEVGPLQPGETRDVGIDFLDVDRARPHIEAGVKFRLREAWTIGEGVFLPMPVITAEGMAGPVDSPTA